MHIYYHTERQNDGLLGVFASHSKQSGLLIHSCQLTHSKSPHPTKKKKKDTKVATNEKRDSILVNLIWGSVLTMKKIGCHLNRIEKH